MCMNLYWMIFLKKELCMCINTEQQHIRQEIIQFINKKSKLWVFFCYCVWCCSLSLHVDVLAQKKKFSLSEIEIEINVYTALINKYVFFAKRSLSSRKGKRNKLNWDLQDFSLRHLCPHTKCIHPHATVYNGEKWWWHYNASIISPLLLKFCS